MIAFSRLVLMLVVGFGILQTEDFSLGLRETVRSNIQRADYVGSQTCGRCHSSIFASFMQSPMHNMTRLPQAAHVNALFDGRSFPFKNDRVVLEERGGQDWIRIESPEYGNRQFRVTRVIGGHHREDFAGVESGRPDSLDERILPVSYMLKSGSFRYKGYSVMTPDRPGLRPGAVWSRTCIFCHNTVPFLSTILGELAGRAAPPYQGKVVDWLLPPEKRWSYEVTDSVGLDRAIETEVGFLKGKVPSVTSSGPMELALQALNTTRELFTGKDLLEVGIGCESCHGGCREHVEDPQVVFPSPEPRSPFLKVKTPPLSPEALHRQEITRMCARCHQVLFSQYPWTREGRKRDDPAPGGAHINSGEARDMLLGRCEATCTDCHDPHASDDRERMKELEGPAGNAICLGCHGQYGAPEALRAHAHHDPAGPGGLCLNCHMPRKNMSLDTELTRYHRVGSPTDPERVEGDRPIECALCHGDKSVGELVQSMESWWPHHYDRAALQNLYGSLEANPLEATLRLGKPHEQAVALYLVGQRHDRQMAPLLIKQLANPYPLVRFYADNALAELLGGPSPLDLYQDTTAITRGAVAWLDSAGTATQLPIGRPGVKK